jgi:hypothetical protein
VWVRGNEGGLDSLTDDAEKFQFTMLAKQLIDLFQTHHYHYERGLVEEEVWGTWATQFRDDVITFPAFREVLERRRKHLRPSFGRFVDENLTTDDV